MKHALGKLLIGIAGVAASIPAQATHEWSVHDGSKLGFTASWEGNEFDGVQEPLPDAMRVLLCLIDGAERRHRHIPTRVYADGESVRRNRGADPHYANQGGIPHRAGPAPHRHLAGVGQR